MKLIYRGKVPTDRLEITMLKSIQYKLFLKQILKIHSQNEFYLHKI